MRYTRHHSPLPPPAARNEYDQTIQETEAAYMKILESSQTLLNVLKRESINLTKKVGGLGCLGAGGALSWGGWWCSNALGFVLAAPSATTHTSRPLPLQRAT